MKLIETLKNIWKIEDLRKRLITTFLFIVIYRFGCHVVLPGINPADLEAMRNFTNSGLMQLLDMFSGGAFGQASIFALGIMPYITASIVIQLMGMVVPSFQKMQREGESGRMKLNQYTRYLTVAILLVQAPAYLMNLQYQVNAAGGHAHIGGWTMIYLSIVLTAGAMLIMWLGEKITDKGIGNGISLIILVGIRARFPGAIVQEFTSRLNTAQGGLVMFLVEIVVLFVCFFRRRNVGRIAGGRHLRRRRAGCLQGMALRSGYHESDESHGLVYQPELSGERGKGDGRHPGAGAGGKH